MLQLRHLLDMEKNKEGENVRNVYISQLQNELRNSPALAVLCDVDKASNVQPYNYAHLSTVRVTSCKKFA